ncbi:hypothetical protein Fleli_1837 [Bernardetia litoralis DSM 6794]|uniref:Lipocalin-like domain-containing protein n=1 Tax=Bernardetia litoralis (strain ATCC 23117 / DSM 6794 / NBRC 15988 / NCIMB 1366 / Fx l1 / Sio-4) TaxID=880071 RepID=I4AJV0_BERLS|nr:lipocalin family protein [Bernardetia litoralis]AFM04235.1 hypothetical protein Fleli_1837 [Bernardetia litoralis DSM 6794]
MNYFIKSVLFIAFSLLFFSCSTSSIKEKKELSLEELLIKTWELHQVAGQNSKYDTNSSEIYHDKYIEFKKDQTYTTNAPKYFKKEKGTWYFSSTKDSIYINKGTEKQIIFRIFHIYERGMSLMSYETENEEDIYGQLYSLQFVEVGYYGSTQIPKDKIKK